MAEQTPNVNSEAERYKDLGNEKYKEGKYLDAVALYSKAIEVDGNKNPAYFGNRAAAWVMLNNHKQAIEDCAQAVKIQPDFVKAYLRAAKCYFQLGKLTESIKQYHEALRFDPKNATALDEMKMVKRVEGEIDSAQREYEAKQYHNALAHLSIAMTQSPASVDLKILKARILYGLKRYQDVISIASDILRDDDESLPGMFLRGAALFKTGNPTGAIKHFQSVLRSDPDNAEARTELKKVNLFEAKKKEGNELFSSGQYQQALDTYSECLAIDPENDSINSTIYSNRAAAYMKLGKYEQAKEDCDKTIQMDPNYVKAYLRRATCNAQLGNHEDVVRDYEKLTQMEPDNNDYARQLRDAKLELKKSKRKDYYKILGVERNADENQIKSAYKKAALKWHPDKNGESEESKKKAEAMFKEISEAYAVLSDTQKKRRYDSGEDLQEMEGGMSDMDMNNIFSMFFGGGMPGGFGGGSPFGGGYGGFGGGMPRSSRRGRGGPSSYDFRYG